MIRSVAGSKTKPLLGAFVVAILAVALLIPAAAHASNMTIRINAPSGQAGKTVDVSIVAAGAPDVGAMQLRLAYDPAVLAAEQVVAGPLLAGALLESNLETTGSIAIAVATTDGIKGDGTLATVRFKVLGKSGQRSDVRIEEAKAWERVGEHLDVLVETAHGQVSIQGAGGGSNLLWILLAAAAVLVVGAGAWYFTRRRGARAAAAPMPAPQAAPAPRAAFCANCGTPLAPAARFCGKCGTPT